MKLNKWVYSINELFDFYINNFAEYTLFLKGNLCIRHDGEYICGTCVVTNNDYDKELRQRLKELYKNSVYLITDIDIKSKHIVFNKIGDNND